ncbi:MAG: APC family permease [Acidobacteriaceae bacterium]|jgi:amino acid transporter
MPLEVLTPDPVPDEAPPDSGLRHNILSPLETLSQSISAIAPTTTPALTVPLVFALAGNGTWLAYLLAGLATLLMALCIARFAQTSASPGSLYKYATDSLPAIGGRTAGWALLLAYTATGASVVGGFINYARVLIPAAHALPTPVIALIATAVATFFAYRDVQASARMMLRIEAASVSMIALVVGALLLRNGLHIDTPQFRLQSVGPSGVRLGVVLALFSFVGFESATTLGHEAKNPLRTIPRAVVQSAILAGLFFLTCCYAETLGFRQLHADLGQSEAPMRALATLARVPLLGPLIDIGAFVSMFACTLACITAAARVLLRMAHDGLVPAHLSRCHAKNETPHIAVLAVGAVVLLLAAGLAIRGASGADIYAWAGSLAVYGFITAYGLVALALPLYLRRRAQLTPAALALSIAAALAMLLALAGTLYPVPQSPYNWLPYIYLAYLALGLATVSLTPRRQDDPAA